MILSYFFVIFNLFSLFFAILEQKCAEVGQAALSGVQDGLELIVAMAGAICLWSAMQKLAERSGLCSKVALLFRPVLKRLFPLSYCDDAAAQSISGNFVSNLLGLGNAATPFGIAAIRRMRQLSGEAYATNEMCRFIVLNTASVQLIPSTLAALRISLGCKTPFDILPAVWLCSLFSVSVGMLACFIMERWYDS